MRWIIVFVLATLVFNALHGWMTKIGLGRLPGDFSFKVRGRVWYVPLASAAVLSVLMALIGLLI
jgi:hypothetical protein